MRLDLNCLAKVTSLQGWLAGGLAVLVFGVEPARAQPALGSSILTEQAFQQRTDQRARAEEEELRSETSPEEEAGVQVGAVRFDLSPAYALEYNDNINAVSTGEESDWIHLPQVTVGLEAPLSERSDLSFSMGLGYRLYASHSELNQLFITPGTQVAWDIQVKDFWLTVYDLFTYSQEVSTEPGLSGQAQFPRFENTAGIRGLWMPGKWLLSAGYGFQYAFSDSTSFSYLDRNTHLITLRGGYRLSYEVQAGIEASGTVTDYSQNINPDGVMGSLGPYLTWQLVDRFTASVRGGGVWYDNDATPALSADSGSSYYAGLDFTHVVTDYITHGFSVYHDLRLGVEAGSALIEQTTVSYHASWRFLDPAALDLRLSYDQGDQSLPSGPVADERFEQFGVGLGVSYQVTERLRCRARYDLAVRKSNAATREYTQNRAEVGVAYQLK